MEIKLFKSLRTITYAIALLALVYFGRAWIIGYEIGLPFQVETTYETQPFLLNYFNIDGEASGIYLDQLLAFQRFFTEEILYSSASHIALFWLFVLVLIITTALISLLDRVSYLMAAGGIAILLSQIQLEELAVFEEYISYVVIGLFIGISYYFQSFKPDSPWQKRILMSLIGYGLLGTVIYVLSPVAQIPIIAISQGIFGPLLLSGLFILFVAGENFFSLFKLATTAQPGKKGLLHFSFIGLVYLVLCFLMFKEKNEGLSFSLYVIGPELLMLCSIASSFFSFDLRHHSLDEKTSLILKHLLFPAFAGLFLFTYGFTIVSVNDSLQSALDWFIIIAHFCLGATYFLYAIVNFAPALYQKLQIWPAFYKGPRTAILTVRLMGFALCLGAIFYLSYRPYYDAKAGQFSMLGDMARHFDRPDVAKSYYEQAAFNDFYSFKANYSINQLAEKAYQQAEGRSRLENVFNHKSNAIARMALANEFANEDRLYRTLTTLQAATKTERSVQLKNNLGLAHNRYNNYDSAFRYFTESGAAVNLAAVKFLLNDRIAPELTTISPITEVKVNQQARANLNQLSMPFDFALASDSVIKTADVYYLYNAAISRQPMNRKALIQVLAAYIEKPENELFASFLLMAKALAHYHDGAVNEAFITIDNVINRAPNTSGFETYLKGIWYFDQGQPELCVEQVNLAQRRGFQNDQIKRFVTAVQHIKQYDQKADIAAELNEALAHYQSTQNTDALVAVATRNAFDHQSTLLATEKLQAINYSPDKIYDLLLRATQINKRNPQLLEAYIYQCQALNLKSFADTALEQYSALVAYEDYFRVAKKLNALREVKSPLN